MKLFDNQIELTGYGWEGFRPYAYPDPLSPLVKATPQLRKRWGFEAAPDLLHTLPLAIAMLNPSPWTLGFGTTGGILPSMSCAENIALDWLRDEFENIRTRLPIITTLLEHQMDAVCDLAYNIGPNGFPKLLAALKHGDMEGASIEFLDGFNANMGLLLRRISEYNTFMGNGYIRYEKTDTITSQLKSLLLLKNGHNNAAVELINSLEVQS